MKKILLIFLVLLLGRLHAQIHGYNADVYMNCNGIRTFIGIAPSINGYGSFILNDCVNLCSGCKLEFNVYKFDAVSNAVLSYQSLTTNLYRPLNNKTNTRIELSPFGPQYEFHNDDVSVNQLEGIDYYSVDLKDYSSISTLDFIRIPVATQPGYQEIIFGCTKIIPSNNLDNVGFPIPTTMKVCKGECLKYKDLIQNIIDQNGYPKAKLTYIGCGSERTLDNSSNPNISPLLEEEICFNQIGEIRLCGNLQDACQNKSISTIIEVVDCELNPICDRCCPTNGSVIPVIRKDNLTNMYYVEGIPKECGKGKWKLVYNDGSAIFIEGCICPNSVSNPGKKLVQICFSIPECPNCWNGCLNIE